MARFLKHPALRLALCLAFAVRLVAPGFAAASSPGDNVVVVCTHADSALTPIAAAELNAFYDQTEPARGPDKGEQSAECAYCFFVQSALSPPNMAGDTHTPTLMRRLDESPGDQITQRTWRAPQSVRGPPIFHVV
ncbi:MAG: DUF2946 family protein [Pseudomonadota bacterium]